MQYFVVIMVEAIKAFFGIYRVRRTELFMILVRSKTKITIDEREQTVREKAAQLTYAIFAPTIGIGSFLLIIFSRGEYYYLEALGMVLAYLSLFLIALYALTYYYFNRKFGGGSEE